MSIDKESGTGSTRAETGSHRDTHRPAPGRAPLTSGIARPGSVQRKDSPAGAAPAAAPGAANPAQPGAEDWSRDPYLDAALRGNSPVQASGELAGPSVQEIAARGVAGAGDSLPHLQTIQHSFGDEHDVGAVRAHVGGEAARASEAIGAVAYASGDHVAFAKTPDVHTAAHEAAHVVQQQQGVQLAGGVGQAGDVYERHADAVADRVVRGEPANDLLAAGPAGSARSGVQKRPAGTIVQRKSINDYADASKPENDPGHLSDAAIQGTTEYTTLVKNFCHPPWIYTESDAVLACKLAIRTLRQGGAVSVLLQGESLMARARDQAAAAGGAEGLANKLQWVPFSSAQAAVDPSKLESEFANWLLVVGKGEPSDTTGKLNCWELVMYGAYKAGVISESLLKAVYAKAVDNVQKGVYASVGLTFEAATKASSPITFKLADKDSPKPLRGDIVVFNSAPVHACIATGNVVVNAGTGKSEHEVVSLWTPNGKKVEKTTIEKLAALTTERPILFWSAKWNGI